MKNLINYYYNMNIDNIAEYNNNHIVFYNNRIYYFRKIDDSLNIYFINQIINNNKYSFFSYKIINNIYNTYITKSDNDNYVMLEIDQDYDKTIDFTDMIMFYAKSENFLSNVNYKNNWKDLWINKIDYLNEYSIKNLLYKNNIYSLYLYYSYLCESLFIYMNNIDVSLIKPSICHRRMYFNIKKIDFYDPFNYMVDCKYRDIAGYIKSLYYINEDYISELKYFLNTNKLSYNEAKLFYSRIIYPSIFFDYYEEGINAQYSYLPDEYEKFIKKTYEIINSYVHIDNIDWL